MRLPTPPVDRSEDRSRVVAWVREHLGHLSSDEVRASPVRGGQTAADTALATLDLTGYANRRSNVLPESSRGASRLSPYIRHGLLTLPAVWEAAGDAPYRDRQKFRDELMWQEYARHVYARVGKANGAPLRFDAPVPSPGSPPPAAPVSAQDPWPTQMACMAATTAELHDDGWLVNQTRMWLASQWAVRAGADWRDGEQEMYRNLLDGSRAANRLGWQWAIGTGTGRVYGFSRWQVEKRAPELCAGCELRNACPVQDWPEAQSGPKVDGPDSLGGGPTDAGPEDPLVTGAPEAVWLTAESLGDADPALSAHPELPAVFVFDEPLLRKLQLSGKRLVFLAEALAEIGEAGELEVHLGDPVTELAGRRLATTWGYVPGFRRRSAQLDVVALHPWPWLRRPGSGSLRSFSAWAGRPSSPRPAKKSGGRRR
ncbi:FAD-binding domain-containing protein [Quadrisphaera sp. INWT6]|uniref:FAD-binding domain-containing protein n=1 Tax=Quadrisphaera sp. INWT6 TaxID=2596917 RepID=UPI002815ED34|nr:FAD-binding domain-containing protein [Quadrisphaera sp. INWT6]